MASPPITIVPLSVVIAEDRILLTVERGTAEVIINSHIASTIIREVPCPIEVGLAINGYAIASAINLDIPCPIDRELSLPINRYAVPSTKLVGVSITINVEVSRPINREVSVAVDGNIASRAKVLIARQVSLAIRAHPGVLIDHRV
jgi:hypothetical protein